MRVRRAGNPQCLDHLFARYFRSVDVADEGKVLQQLGHVGMLEARNQAYKAVVLGKEKPQKDHPGGAFGRTEVIGRLSLHTNACDQQTGRRQTAILESLRDFNADGNQALPAIFAQYNHLFETTLT